MFRDSGNWSESNLVRIILCLLSLFLFIAIVLSSLCQSVSMLTDEVDFGDAQEVGLLFWLFVNMRSLLSFWGGVFRNFVLGGGVFRIIVLMGSVIRNVFINRWVINLCGVRRWLVVLYLDLV